VVWDAADTVPSVHLLRRMIDMITHWKIDAMEMSLITISSKGTYWCGQIGSFAPGGPLSLAKKLETVWRIDPHTQAKHTILRRYWEAWLPIMTKYNQRVLYIDGFAGPRLYAGGEDGSPLIALKAARDHRAKPKSEVVFTFIEKDK